MIVLRVAKGNSEMIVGGNLIRGLLNDLSRRISGGFFYFEGFLDFSGLNTAYADEHTFHAAIYESANALKIREKPAP